VEKILHHALSAALVVDVLGYEPSIREAIVEEPTARLQQLLNFGFDGEQISILLNYSGDMRQELMDTQDGNLVKSLLSLDLDEADLDAILPGISRNVESEINTEELAHVELTNRAGEELEEDDVVSDSLVQLLESTSDNGNEHIVPSLYEMGDGVVDDKLLEVGALGNRLLTDAVLTDALDVDRLFDVDELIDNYFYSEVALLFETWADAEDLLGQDGFSSAFAGRRVTLEAGLVELGEYFAAGNRALYITSSEDMEIAESVVFSSTDGAGGAMKRELSLMAAGRFLIEDGVTLEFADGGLNLGSRETSEFIKVSMEAGGDLNIASLENLVFENSELRVGAGDSIHLSAFSELSVNGLQLSDNVREIYMQAITIDLRNIYFPNGSSVMLQSQFGGIDGIYPTFPTGDPKDLFGNREVGRVNFIENVGYDKTTIDTRATFDQFRDRIQISPLR